MGHKFKTIDPRWPYHHLFLVRLFVWVVGVRFFLVLFGCWVFLWFVFWVCFGFGEILGGVGCLGFCLFGLVFVCLFGGGVC